MCVSSNKKLLTQTGLLCDVKNELMKTFLLHDYFTAEIARSLWIVKQLTYTLWLNTLEFCFRWKSKIRFFFKSGTRTSNSHIFVSIQDNFKVNSFTGFLLSQSLLLGKVTSLKEVYFWIWYQSLWSFQTVLWTFTVCTPHLWNL